MGRGKNLIIILFVCLVIFVWPVMADPDPPKDWKVILAQTQAQDYQNTIPNLKKLLDSNPEPIWQKRALFLLAYTYKQLGKLPEAEDYFTRARKDYDKLRDYIELELGKIWLAQGKPHRAYELIKSFGEKYPKSLLVYDAQLLEAHALKEMGDYAQAIAKYQGVIEGEGLANRKKEAEAIFGWAESLAKTGQSSPAWELYSRLYFDYPEQTLADASWREMNILDKHKVLNLAKSSLLLYLKRAEKLRELGRYALALKDYENIISVQPSQEFRENAVLKKAFCQSMLRERTEAKSLLEQFIAKYPGSHYLPEGLYYLARLYWTTKDYYRGEGAIKRLIKTFPADAWTEKGMLVLGLMKEEEGRWPQARRVYQDMARQFPKGELLPEVYWRWGWTEYATGEYARAAQVFKDLTLLSKADKLRDKALYWYARALEKAGQEEKAQEYYEELARNYPYSYYGIKGEERWRKSQEPKGQGSGVRDQGSEVSLIPRPPPPKDMSWTAEQNYYLERIRELAVLAFYVEGQQELKYLMKLVSPDTNCLYPLAKFSCQTGFYHDAIKILSRILLTKPVKDRNQFPAELWQLFYPLPYWEQVNSQARQYRQDPYLIMAIIRQESAFQSGAISSAGACGLMQILPSTGEFISQSLSKDGFKQHYLFDPDSNISLGIWYFNYLQKRFDRNLILALAGYNAGPEKVKEWLKSYAVNDPEEFIENIPYNETRDYIKNILRNQIFYQKIYGAKRIQ